MVVYLKLNKENSFNNDQKATFYTIFLTAQLARLATLSSLSSLFHGLLIQFSLTSRHSLPSSSAQNFVIHTHTHKLHTLNVSTISSPRPNFLYCLCYTWDICNRRALERILGPFPELAHPSIFCQIFDSALEKKFCLFYEEVDCQLYLSSIDHFIQYFITR